MEISKKHPPFLHYLKEMSAKMADSLLMTASGALPEELFEYFVDGVHLFEIILLATAAHMIAWIVIGRDIKLHLRTVAQRGIGIHLLHEDSPDRQRHGSTLTHTHGIEVDIALLTAYPAATYQLRSKGDEPTVCYYWWYPSWHQSVPPAYSGSAVFLPYHYPLRPSSW